MNERKAFLVFSGTNDRAVLAFLRALDLCGHRAYIVARTSGDRILRTKYRRDVKLVRETPELTLPIFLDCVKRVQSMNAHERLIILPSSEYFNHFVLKNRGQIEALGLEVPLVAAEIYERVTNKLTAAALFASAGIDIPSELNSPDPNRLPMVAKPLRNVDAHGVSLYPVLLHTSDDLMQFSATYEASDFFFQEFVRGQSLYLFAHIAHDPDRVVLWSQRNLMQQPQGKSMLFAEPHQLHNQQITKRLVEILLDVRFTGLCMIELIQKGDRFVFIEMNPRIWGPIQFCLDQGQPLLQAFIGSALHGDPERYLHVRAGSRRAHYFWTGGLLEALISRNRVDWHVAPISWFKLVRIAARNDIYLRADSWRCFVFEIGQLLRRVSHGNRNQR